MEEVRLTLAWRSPHYGHFGLTWNETETLTVIDAMALHGALKKYLDRDRDAVRASKRGR